MKLEYRDLSSSRTARPKRAKGFSFGFADVFAASLLAFVIAAYLILPKQVERGVDFVVYDSRNNSYASFRCIAEKTTKHQFTLSRNVPELRDSVRVLHHRELDRLHHPQPDAVCYAAKGFVESVPRWEYFFGWLLRAVG